MTTPFENFVNTALGKSLSADVTLPTANDIPVFTGIGRQVTGKTIAELGLALFTPVELLASSATQNLEPNYSYYLPAFYSGALNLAMPTSAAIGTTFDIGSIYSYGLDGTIGANLTALNLTVPAGEFITGWGGAPNPINLLVSYSTLSDSWVTPNFTPGCTFRLTKTGATSWAIKPTFGSVMPKRFLVKNEGGVGGTIVSTAVPAGTYRELTLPNADVDLGDLPNVASTNFNTLSGTRTRIVGGSHNTVSGTDNVVVSGTSNTLSDTSNTAVASLSCTLTGTYNASLWGSFNSSNSKNNCVLAGRKAIAYTDFEEVNSTYFGTAHTGGVRAFYDRFAPSTRTYRTYIFGDISNVSVQNSYSLSFKPIACLSSAGGNAAATHRIVVTALKMASPTGAASQVINLLCSWDGTAYSIVRSDEAVLGTAGIMAAFTFSIDSSGYLIITKVAQTSDWGYFIHGTAYHTASA